MTLVNTIKADWNAPKQIIAFSTTRKGGGSKSPCDSFNFAKHVGDDENQVEENRRLLARQLSPDLQWQWLQQVHSNEVVTVSELTPEAVADAVIIKSPNLVGCVQTADCLAVFLAARNGSEIALAHAGWRGLASGILENTIRSMSTPAAEVIAWFGPAIGACHFEVGTEVQEFFLQATTGSEPKSEIKSCFRPSATPGKFMADIYTIARLKLAWLGVAEVSGGHHCTYCEKDEFYSYRRDGITGRMLNAIYIEA